MVQRRAQVFLALLLNVVLLVDVIGGWTVPSEPGLPDADDDSEIIDADTDLFDSIPSDTDPEETCPGRQSYRLGIDPKHLTTHVTEYRAKDEDGNDRFFIMGTPAYPMEDYDNQLLRQQLQNNGTLPHGKDFMKHIGDLQNLLNNPKAGQCWSLSGSLKPVKSKAIPDTPMISDLVCMDVSSMLKVTNIAKDPKMAKKQETFVRGCEANGNRVVSESIYTKDSIFTSNFANTTECYSQLPCFECEQEVIEIERDNSMVWNEVGWSSKSASGCSSEETPIPAASWVQCHRNGGKFIKSIDIPERTLKCVRTYCGKPTREFLESITTYRLMVNNCRSPSVAGTSCDVGAYIATSMYYNYLQSNYYK